MRAVLVLVLIAGCGRIGFDPLGAGGDAHTGGGGDDGGGGTIDGPPPCMTFGAWGAPTRLNELASTALDYSPAITPDGLTIYFQSERASALDDLWVATRASTSDMFSVPVPLPVLNSSNSDRDPTITGGGLYFSSDRPPATATVDRIYSSAGSGTQFAAPSEVSELGIGVFGPWVSYDELDIYYIISAQLYHATRTVRTNPWGAGVLIAELGNAGYATLSPDQLTIYFERAGIGIMTATRSSRGAAFSTPVLFDVANTGFNGTGDPEISADGLTFYFDGDLSGGDYDIYKTTRACLD